MQKRQGGLPPGDQDIVKCNIHHNRRASSHLAQRSNGPRSIQDHRKNMLHRLPCTPLKLTDLLWWWGHASWAHLVHEGGLVEGGAVGDVEALGANLLLGGLQHLARLLLLPLLYLLRYPRLLTLQPVSTQPTSVTFQYCTLPNCPLQCCTKGGQVQPRLHAQLQP